MTKTIFFGTEKFAAGILEALINSAKFNIDLVITQPDRPVGRKQELQKPPVKIVAEKYGLKIDQPEKLKEYIFPEDTDLNIVCEYGLIIPKRIVAAPKFGSINVHPSLLPKYRGASPIQSVLINGETETGVSIMIMDEKMDHGPILRQDTVKIDRTDTYTTLAEKLLKTAIFGLLEATPGYLQGKITPRIQDESKVTFCTMFTKESGHVDWKKTATEIYNLGRGLEVWPGLWTTFQNKRIKLLEVLPSTAIIPVGKIVLENNKVLVGCKDSTLEIVTLQPEGKNTMSALAWVNGIHNLADAKMI
jgi:methionyl-tRNA formyltransferase